MKNLNLKSKLILLLLFPIIGLIFLSITISYDRYLIYSKLDMLNKVVLLSTKTRALIYSLQKERGFSNGYEGSKGKDFKNEFLKQQNKTTQEKKEFLNYLKNIELKNYGNDFKSLINKGQKELDEIDKIREKILTLNMEEKELNFYYSNLINTFLETITYISTFSNNSTLNQELYAYSNLIYAIEKIANERGFGTNAFSSKKFSFEMRDELHNLISEQNVYLKNFEKNTNKESLIHYKKIFKGEIIEESIRMRNILLNTIKKEFTPKDSSSYWFNTMTKKISILKEIDNYLIEEILQKTHTISNNAKIEMNTYIILCLFVILAVLIIGRKISINIVNSVNDLLQGIDRFFKFVNKKSNYIEPIDIKSNDEIGIISKMINEKIIVSKKIIDEDIIERAKNLEIEVKKKTSDLEIRNNKYKILLDRFNEHTIATRTNLKGIITFATDKFCKISGYSKKELIGQNHNIMRHPDVPKTIYQNLWETIQSGEKFIGELKNKKKDGSEYWLKVIIVPEFNSNGNIIGYFSVKENIDDKIKIREFNTQLEKKIKKAVEESRKKDELLSYQSKLATMGEMIDIIAHQWKQPLSSLAMRIQSIKFKKYTNKNSEYTNYIDEFVSDNMQLINFMSKTIDDFRNFFRQDKRKEKFNIINCIHKTLNILKPQLIESKITISLEGDDFITYGLQSEFQQVIVNLICNARDVLLEKKINNPIIKITTQIKDNKGILLISDNAGGIPTEILEKVFEPYFTTKEQGKGTGIGLYISKTIIEDTMKGQLSVSNIQEGASFQIIVPLS